MYEYILYYIVVNSRYVKLIAAVCIIFNIFLTQFIHKLLEKG